LAKKAATFRLPVELLEAVDVAVKRAGVSKTEWVERALRRAVEGSVAPTSPAMVPEGEVAPALEAQDRENEIEVLAKQIYHREGVPMSLARRMAKEELRER
jgi:hypothetical protein